MTQNQTIPESILEAQRKAGKARAAQITHEERVKWGKLSWTRRLRKAQLEAGQDTAKP